MTNKEKPPKNKCYVYLGENSKCLDCGKSYCICKKRRDGTWENDLPVICPPKQTKPNKIMKDETLIYYKIKITRIREREGTRNDCSYKDKLWCVDIKIFDGSRIMFCETTLKKAFKQLKESLYI